MLSRGSDRERHGTACSLLSRFPWSADVRCTFRSVWRVTFKPVPFAREAPVRTVVVVCVCVATDSSKHRDFIRFHLFESSACNIFPTHFALRCGRLCAVYGVGKPPTNQPLRRPCVGQAGRPAIQLNAPCSVESSGA